MIDCNERIIVLQNLNCPREIERIISWKLELAERYEKLGIEKKNKPGEGWLKASQMFLLKAIEIEQLAAQHGAQLWAQK